MIPSNREKKTLLPDKRTLEIIEMLVPGLNVRSSELVPIGWSNEIHIVNDEYVIKIRRQGKQPGFLTREKIVTDSIRHLLPVSIPDFISVIDREDLGAAAYRKIPGVLLTYEETPGFVPHPRARELLQGESGKGIARQLAAILNSLHGVDRNMAEELLSQFGIESWKEVMSHSIQEARNVTSRALAGDIAAGCREFLDRLQERVMSGEFEERLIHGDFGGWNILVDHEAGKLTGILDWEGCRLGDPALDFRELLFDFGEGFVSEILENYRYRSDSQLMSRARDYLSLSGFMDMEYALESGNEFYMKRGLKLIDRFVRS